MGSPDSDAGSYAIEKDWGMWVLHDCSNQRGNIPHKTRHGGCLLTVSVGSCLLLLAGRRLYAGLESQTSELYALFIQYVAELHASSALAGQDWSVFVTRLPSKDEIVKDNRQTPKSQC